MTLDEVKNLIIERYNKDYKVLVFRNEKDHKWIGFEKDNLDLQTVTLFKRPSEDFISYADYYHDEQYSIRTMEDMPKIYQLIEEQFEKLINYDYASKNKTEEVREKLDHINEKIKLKLKNYDKLTHKSEHQFWNFIMGEIVNKTNDKKVLYRLNFGYDGYVISSIDLDDEEKDYNPDTEFEEFFDDLMEQVDCKEGKQRVSTN